MCKFKRGIGSDTDLQLVFLGIPTHQQQPTTGCYTLFDQCLNLCKLRLGERTDDLCYLSIELNWFALRYGFDL